MTAMGSASGGRVWVLALATFATGTEGYVYAGLLADLAGALQVTVGRAGLLAAAFAITYAVLAPPLAALTAGLPRRGVLVGGLAVLALINLLASLSASFEWLLASRVACGVVAAIVGPAATVTAASLVPPERRGRAVALVSAGLALAFTLGVPIGSAVGGAFGWRATFVFAGLLLLLAAGLIRLVLPPVPGTDRTGLATLGVAARPAVAARLVVTAGAFTATFCSIAYLGPIVNRAVGAEGAAVGAFQACIGLGSVVGIVAGGRWADRPGPERALPILFAIIALTQVGFVAAPALDPVAASVLIAAAIFVGASALFAIMPIVQVALIAAAPTHRSVVLALNGSMVFLGQGLGAALGSVATSTSSLTATGMVGGALAACLGASVATALATLRRRAILPVAGPSTGRRRSGSGGGQTCRSRRSEP